MYSLEQITYPGSLAFLRLVCEIGEGGYEVTLRDLVTPTANNVGSTVALTRVLVTHVVVGTASIAVAGLATIRLFVQPPVTSL